MEICFFLNKFTELINTPIKASKQNEDIIILDKC